MSNVEPSATRRDLLVAAAAVGAAAVFQAAAASDIRPFQVHVPDEALADLRRRVTATKWPTEELVPDASQGVQRATKAQKNASQALL